LSNALFGFFEELAAFAFLLEPDINTESPPSAKNPSSLKEDMGEPSAPPKFPAPPRLPLQSL
jgi:hypothetical protein